MSGGWRIQVDARRCSGSGLCAGIAPDHFVLVDGISTPTSELVEDDERVIDAAECCPMEAITITDVADGRTIAPAP